jgi:hypothetical protein
MRMTALKILWVLLGFLQPEAPYRESLDDYEARELLGFTLMVNHNLIESEPVLLERVLLQLEHDIDQISSVVPAAQFDVLRGSTIWIELQGSMELGGGTGRGMCFHPSSEWLTAHGLLPEKEGGVEIVRAADFPAWRLNQPFMLFHELAHAYHWRLGFEREDVRSAYEAAMQSGLYDAVPYNMAADGEPVRAYAAENEREYFAEASEAYFGLNDYFPFTRRQLRSHDPRGFELVRRLWTLPREEIAAPGEGDAGDADSR